MNIIITTKEIIFNLNHSILTKENIFILNLDPLWLTFRPRTLGVLPGGTTSRGMSLTLWVWSRSWGYLTWPPLTWTMWTWRLYCPIYRSWSTGMDQTLSLTGSWHLSQTLIGLIVDTCIRTDLNRVSPDVSFKRSVKSLKLLKIRFCVLFTIGQMNIDLPVFM